MAEFQRQLLLLRGVCIYKSLLQDSLVNAYVSLLEALASKTGPEDLLDNYTDFLSQLVEKTELGAGGVVGDPWRNYVLELILNDENSFTRKAEYVSFRELSPGILALAKQDLRSLQKGLFISWDKICSAVRLRLKEQAFDFLLPECNGTLYPLSSGSERGSRLEAKQALADSEDWGQCLETLAAFARKNGCGIYGRFSAFRWVPGHGLVGIANPDPVRLDDLFSYERQKEKIAANTKRFVQGFPANNVLLYGDRGTGKSSTVKALIHEFWKGGLRLIEVSREGFKELPEIMALLSQRPQRFVIFIDDLSFEEYETEYKSLKAVMEGGIQAQPENVLIYATSNRKHLIRETFGDRTMSEEEGEVHPGDSLEEKISLADRFGLVVTFSRPDQKTYLEIVKGLAQKEGISVAPEELERLALKWEMLNNGRSGRTARQFVQDLAGKSQYC